MQELRAGFLLAELHLPELGNVSRRHPAFGADAEPLLGCQGQTHSSHRQQM